MDSRPPNHCSNPRQKSRQSSYLRISDHKRPAEAQMHLQLKSRNFPKHKKPLLLRVGNRNLLHPFATVLYCSRQRIQMQSMRLGLHRPCQKSRHQHRNWLRRGPFVTEEKGSEAILHIAPEIGAKASLESGSEGPWRASNKGTFKAKTTPCIIRSFWTAAKGFPQAITRQNRITCKTAPIIRQTCTSKGVHIGLHLKQPAVLAFER